MDSWHCRWYLGGGTARWTEEGAEPWEQGARMQPRILELRFKPEPHEDHMRTI